MSGFSQFFARTKHGTEILCDNHEAPVVIRNEDGRALVMHDELLHVIYELTNAAIAKGLLPAKEEASAPFHQLPPESTPAAIIYDAFVTSDGVERHAVAYVNDDGILILEAIGNERNTIEYAQFGTDDLRTMLALKEGTR